MYPRINQLEARFLEPSGFNWGAFTNDSKARIRYGWIAPDGEPRPVVVFVPGRGAPIEKYFEPIRELLGRGYAVWSMDWRGQGGSDRYLKNPQKGHSLCFEQDVVDLHQFVTTIVNRRDKPLILLAGSLGAHISLRYLHDHRDTFAFAVLVSPMMDINTGTWPRWIVRLLARLATGFGLGGSYVLGGGDWKPDTKHLTDARKSSSDAERFSVMLTYFRERPDLRVGSPTYRWLNVAFNSISIVNKPEYLKAIKTPVLITSSGDDTEVVAADHERTGRLIPNCRLLSIPGARHDLYMERDEFRDQLFNAFDQFATEIFGRLKNHEP